MEHVQSNASSSDFSVTYVLVNLFTGDTLTARENLPPHCCKSPEIGNLSILDFDPKFGCRSIILVHCHSFVLVQY
jgi:hypothetical protein